MLGDAQHQQPLGPADLSGTLLVRDCLEAQGAFLLATALRAALGATQQPPSAAAPAPRVLLLAAAQAATHYSAALRKVGLQLGALQDSGRLVLVDLLSSLDLSEADSSGAATPLPSLRDVHRSVTAAAAALGSGGGSGGMCLVVDDLTALHCLAEGPADWAAFLHSCVALGAAPGCCFVGLAHRDVAGDAPWLARLEHVAALVLDVEPLESGPSAATTGRVAITRRVARPAAAAAAARDAPAAAALLAGGEGEAPGVHRMCYKLGETGVSFAAALAGPL